MVDDEPQVRRTLRAILTGQGCNVIEARDGEEAIEEVRADCPDLLLLDINMPGIDGLEACKRIRELSDVPIIMVTVRGSEKDKVVALDAGADDYLVKPFGTQELLARVRAAVRRLPSAEEIPPFVSPNLKIDFEHRRVIARGQAVHLTPTEFELLKQLVVNQGKPVSHLKLLHLLWGPEHSDGSGSPCGSSFSECEEKYSRTPTNPDSFLLNLSLAIVLNRTLRSRPRARKQG